MREEREGGRQWRARIRERASQRVNAQIFYDRQSPRRDLVPVLCRGFPRFKEGDEVPARARDMLVWSRTAGEWFIAIPAKRRSAQEELC